MGRTISRIVKGNPVAQKRHRHRNAGKFVQTYDPSKKEKADFLAKVLEQGPLKVLEGPLHLTVVFAFDRPQSHLKTSGLLRSNAPKEKTSKPDLDNLVKFLKDALNKHAYHDDSQIISMEIKKLYGPARTDFTIQELN